MIKVEKTLRKVFKKIFKVRKVVKPYVHRHHPVKGRVLEEEKVQEPKAEEQGKPEEITQEGKETVKEGKEEMTEEMQALLADIQKEVSSGKKVKVARKNKELIERDENAKVIITEDNKLLLND